MVREDSAQLCLWLITFILFMYEHDFIYSKLSLHLNFHKVEGEIYGLEHKTKIPQKATFADRGCRDRKIIVVTLFEAQLKHFSLI